MIKRLDCPYMGLQFSGFLSLSQTARSDLLELAKRGVLEQKMGGQTLVFQVPPDMNDRLRELGKAATVSIKPDRTGAGQSTLTL